MTALATELQFQVPTTNTDGSAITEPLTYTAFIDTVNPPVKSYSVPAANVTAAVAGLVTVKFSDLGFTPVANTEYFIEVNASDAAGTSAMSAEVTFSNVPVPNPPTGLKVS